MKRHLHFLRSLAHAFSTLSLYKAGHPARQEAFEEAYQELKALLDENPNPVFSFLDGEVVYGDKLVRELKRWPMSARLEKISVQRLEFRMGVNREELEDFLEHMLERLSGELDSLEASSGPFPHIRFGLIQFGRRERRGKTGSKSRGIEGVDLLHQQAFDAGRLSPDVATSVVEALAMTLQQGRSLMISLAPLKDHDQYSTVHSLNTSVLSMALAEFLDLGSEDVRVIGEAALLHDVGKVLVPKDILNKPGRLTPEEWEVVKRHAVDGAKILLKSGSELALPAIVAYEHHITWDGGGYPELHFHRRAHRVSRLIQICDAYDACRTRRPFRAPLPARTILENLERGAGRDFDPLLVKAFAKMIRRWESQLAAVEQTRAPAENGASTATGVDGRAADF